MSPPPRRLSFAVSTSLLTASLALGAGGCDGDAKPDAKSDAKKAPEEVKTVNEGPETPQQPEPPIVEHTVNPVEPPDPQPNGLINDGPENPPPDAEPLHVNEGPEPSPKPEPVPPPAQDKRVNTRPTDGGNAP